MRWKNKTYKVGDTKIVNKFLWLPLSINGETRWLERASYKATYKLTGYDYPELEPIPVEWINK